ncbi:MAG: 30S ribosomal protein S6 [Acidobacteriota bacterium]
MSRYESIFIASPQLSENDFDSLRQSFQEVIQTNGGNVAQSDSWGKRRLAYRVQKQEEGYFGFFLFEGTGPTVRELERRYRLHEGVIKFLCVKAPPEGVKIAGQRDFLVKRPEAEKPSEGPVGESPAGESPVDETVRATPPTTEAASPQPETPPSPPESVSPPEE